MLYDGRINKHDKYQKMDADLSFYQNLGKKAGVCLTYS